MLIQNWGFTTNPERSMHNPYVGISTFLKAPYEDNLDELDADVAVLGMPYDLGTAVRSGARYAPRAIREASTFNCYAYEGWFNPLDEEVYMDKNWKVVDVGDVDVIHTDYKQSFENCEAAIRKIVERGAIPFTIGGDHAITIPVLRGFDKYKDICVIHIDAHLDFTNSAAGVTEGQGSPMRRASEMEHIGQIVQLGMRGIGSSQSSDWKDAREYGNIIMNMKQVREAGIKKVLDIIPDAKHYYVSFDIDGMDQSLAPGCGSPVPFGFQYEELTELFEGINKKGKVVGFDLVEVCPQYDQNESTSMYAAALMLEMLSFIWKYRK